MTFTGEQEPDYLREILTSRVYDVVKETPCELAVGSSERTGTNVYLKREDLQPVFSFKLRGAYNMMAQLPEDKRWKGVISCSAGNHAQGVAYSARHLNIPATIVMPLATPGIKVENVRRLGAQVVLYGDDFDSAKAECARLEKLHGLQYIPPFDDPLVIAGQGTIGVEILRQVDLSKLKAIFCAIGGGGMAAGISAYVKRIAPHIKVYGVETFDADAMDQSLKGGERVTLKEAGLFADGTAVKIVGEETFRVCQKYLDGVVKVNTDEICAAINDVFLDTRSVVEPSGAMALAGIKKYLETAGPEALGDQNAYCAVLSGANMNFDRLRFVTERSRLGAGKEVFFIVEMPEKPGMFRKLIGAIHPRAVTEFAYRYRSPDLARVYISFSVGDRSEVAEIISEITNSGMKAHDMSDNDLAKSHCRYMVGGSADLAEERLFSFEFPERPGALFKFLENLKTTSNISLFHYRDNGSDIARVLVGIIPSADENIDEFAKRIGYSYEDVTDNVAYQLFLK